MIFIINGLGLPTWFLIERIAIQELGHKVLLVLRKGRNQHFKDIVATFPTVKVIWVEDDEYFRTLGVVLEVAGYVPESPITYINVVSSMETEADIRRFKKSFNGVPENATIINISSGAVTSVYEIAGESVPVTTYPGYKKHMEDFLQIKFRDRVWNIRVGFLPDVVIDNQSKILMETLSSHTMATVLATTDYCYNQKGFVGTTSAALVDLILQIGDQPNPETDAFMFTTRTRDGVRHRMTAVAHGENPAPGPLESEVAPLSYQRAVEHPIIGPLMPTTADFDEAIRASRLAILQ